MPVRTKIKQVKKGKLLNRELFLKYFFIGYNKKRFVLEILIPLLLAIIIILISFLANNTITTLLYRIASMNSQIAVIIAIQIGFNITCLSLISAYNKQALKDTFSKVQESEKETVLKQLLASFIYCVFVQTGILIFGILYNIAIEDILKIGFLKEINPLFKVVSVYLFFLAWSFIVVHSFTVFLRNVSLIYKVILVNFRDKK